jgi:hypothetical protein
MSNIISDHVSSVVFSFLKYIAKENSINYEDLVAKWEDTSLWTSDKRSAKQPKESSMKQSSMKETDSEVKHVKKSPKASPKTNTCIHTMTRGANSGKPCGAKCEDKYCKKHEKSEDSNKKVTKKSVKDVTPLVHAGDDTPQVHAKKNIHGNYELSGTGGLIVDKNDQKVIGKQKGDSVVELTSDDIDLCKKMNLMFITPKVMTGSGAEEEEEIESESEEEEDDVDGDEDYSESDE